MDASRVRRLLVTDRTLVSSSDFPEAVAAAVRACGVTMVLVRELDLPPDVQVELGRRIAARVTVPVLLSRSPALAAAAGAAGVQLGAGSPSVSDARGLLGPSAIIGVSVHEVDEGVMRWREGADYLVLGPIFATPKKRGILDPIGLVPMERISRAVTIPVVGIGGIDASNEREVLAAGASGVAAIRWFMTASTSVVA